MRTPLPIYADNKELLTDEDKSLFVSYILEALERMCGVRRCIDIYTTNIEHSYALSCEFFSKDRQCIIDEIECNPAYIRLWQRAPNRIPKHVIHVYPLRY